MEVNFIKEERKVVEAEVKADGPDYSKILRDHDNIIKNLRQEVNQLTNKSDQHDSNIGINSDTLKGGKDLTLKSIVMEKVREHNERIADAENAILLLKSIGSSGK